MRRRSRIVAKIAGIVIAVGLIAGVAVTIVVARWFSAPERFAFDTEASRAVIADGADEDPAAARPADDPEPPPADESEDVGADSDDPAEQPDGYDPVLLLGSDARDGLGGARADVIMMVLLPHGDGRPVMFSLPRDLYIHNLCHGGMSRINAGLNGCGTEVSGPEMMAILVEDFTGLTVRHVVKIDFEGFTDVIDTLGGIEICTDRPLRDERFTLPEGCVNADGELALSWVRSRTTQEFSDGSWRRMAGVDDLTRNERQQDVILQVMERVSTVRSPATLHRLASNLNESVAVSDTLSIGTAVDTAWSMRNAHRDDFVRFAIPIERYRTSGGAEVLLPVEPFDVTLARALDQGA
jgi:polyisoprenyl-teichoic acid--peptidoglycan teichoic acid transferase